MKFVLSALAFATMLSGFSGCSSAPAKEDPSAMENQVEASAPVEPAVEAPKPIDTPVADSKPVMPDSSLGAGSSGRGH